jgi:NAD dependent epimerase/dehydratase family enzyme
MFLFAIENKNLEGTYNAVSPKPVTNKELTQKAAHKYQKPFVNIGVPAFALKLVLGEMSQMVLGGNKVSGVHIQNAGFQFRYPELEEALSKTFNED